MRKNKFLTFVLAVCMILPAMFALTACGKGDKTTVDDTTLAYALEFKDANGDKYTNWQAEKVDNRKNEKLLTVKYTKDDSVEAYYSYAENSAEKIYINSTESGTKFYTFYEKLHEDYGWTKTRAKGSFANLNNTAIQNLQIKDLSTETFTRNSKDGSYDFTKLSEETETSKEQIAYKLKFSNDKMISVNIIKTKTTLATDTTEEEVETIYDWTWTISYDTATIEIPSDFSVVGDTQWKEALSFDVTNFTSTMKNYTLQGGISRSITTYVTPTAAYQKDISASSTHENYYDLTNKKVYSKSKSDDKYTINDGSYLTSFTAMLGYVNANMANYYSSIKNSFASFEYKADEKVYCAENVTLEGTNYQSAKLTFDNGKLVKTELTTGTGTRTWSYTYGDAVVTLPSDSECIVTIPMVTSEGTVSFTLSSNVTLEANTTRIFAIAINSDYFDANKDDATGKCTIDGEFKVTLSGALGKQFEKIVVKDASGNEIDNSSADDGGFNCEISAAGKYYIEITAKTKCTGNWDIGFAG